MAFIGIVTEAKSKKRIMQYLQERIKNERYFFIDEKNLANIQNIKFKIVVLNKYISDKGLLKELINKADYVLMNEDIIDNYRLVENMELNIVTYGFNSKSTITASSISNGEILICFQRGIVNIERKNN